MGLQEVIITLSQDPAKKAITTHEATCPQERYLLCGQSQFWAASSDGEYPHFILAPGTPWAGIRTLGTSGGSPFVGAGSYPTLGEPPQASLVLVTIRPPINIFHQTNPRRPALCFLWGTPPLWLLLNPRLLPSTHP